MWLQTCPSRGWLILSRAGLALSSPFVQSFNTRLLILIIGPGPTRRGMNVPFSSHCFELELHCFLSHSIFLSCICHFRKYFVSRFCSNFNSDLIQICSKIRNLVRILILSNNWAFTSLRRIFITLFFLQQYKPNLWTLSLGCIGFFLC